MRQNPPYYHSLLTEARFAAEQGMVDYKIRVTPELVERWQQMLRAAEASGFRVVSFAEADKSQRAEDFTAVWETAFARHWGISPGSPAGWEETFARTEPAGSHEASVIAYRGVSPSGSLSAFPTSPTKQPSSGSDSCWQKSASTGSGLPSSRASGVLASTWLLPLALTSS
jgi:hypothetical protein